MVNACVYGGCLNSSLSGHRVHRFPAPKTPTFRAWVRFVRLKRHDFTSSSVSTNSVICSAHFRQEDYNESDLSEHRMGFRSKDKIRLKSAAVPSVHSSGTERSEQDPPGAAGTMAAASRSLSGASCRPAARKLEVARAVKLKKTHKHQTNQLQKHFPGGKPTDSISDPVPAAPTTSETYKSARRTRARHPSSERPASKRRKTLKEVASAYTRNERADHHSNTSVQPGYGHQNKDAFTVLRLYKRSPLDFGADAKTSSPCAVQKMFVQQFLVVKVELPNQDSWSPSSDQKPPQIKWEQEDADITEFTFSSVPVKSEDDEEKPQPSELLYKQHPQIKEEQEEADIKEFIFNPVPVKDEDEEEKPQFSQLHHSWNDESTESVGSNPGRCLKSDPEDKHSESSETDVSDGNWEETSAAQPDHFPVSGVRHGSPQTPSPDENPFSCSICVQCFTYGPILHSHDDTHTGDKPFRCNICKAAFGQKLFFVRHMKIHTGETLFSFYE